MSLQLLGIASGFSTVTEVGPLTVDTTNAFQTGGANYQYNTGGKLVIQRQPEPQIVVSGNIIGTNLNPFLSELTSLPGGRIMLAACAIPTGVLTVPQSANDLIYNYVFQNGNNGANISILNSNNVTAVTQSTIGSFNYTPLSGNAYYNIYATHVLTSRDDQTVTIQGYGTPLLTLTNVLTVAPSPSANDVTFNILDTSELYNGTIPLTTFNINFNSSLYNFSNLTSFGPGYPGLASSGAIQVVCRSVGGPSTEYFPLTYSGGTSNIPLPYFAMPGGNLTWKVPKFYDPFTAGSYASYDFDVSYINSSGLVSGVVTFNFTSDSLKTLDKGSFSTPTADPGNLNKSIFGPVAIPIAGTTGRSRLAVAINDINLATVQYNQVGTFVSTPYTNTDPIYALSIRANESTQSFPNLSIWNFIKYYIQFDVTDNGIWYPISPKPRSNEIDISGNLIPNIYILDTNLLTRDMNSPLYSRVGFISIGDEQYSFRVKITMDTTKGGLQGQFSPKVFDYQVSVVNRSAMLSNNFNQYLFN